ncbi:hypothetical protein Q1695_006715 [Nippostrongylus brasiliensis]|nr:hypothetical protein Q1695_006715 [Nippostrongylus brasiliensis]
MNYKTGYESDSSVSGVSVVGTEGADGRETMAFTRRRRGLSAAATSKVNVLITIVAVLFSLFLGCVILSVCVLIHHSRMVTWFPALVDVTGDGFVTEVNANDELLDL